MPRLCTNCVGQKSLINKQDVYPWQLLFEDSPKTIKPIIGPNKTMDPCMIDCTMYASTGTPTTRCHVTVVSKFFRVLGRFATGYGKLPCCVKYSILSSFSRNSSWHHSDNCSGVSDGISEKGMRLQRQEI